VELYSQIERKTVTNTIGAAFETLHFLNNLQIGPISGAVSLLRHAFCSTRFLFETSLVRLLVTSDVTSTASLRLIYVLTPSYGVITSTAHISSVITLTGRCHYVDSSIVYLSEKAKTLLGRLTIRSTSNS
jgi:hypothetical protein